MIELMNQDIAEQEQIDLNNINQGVPQTVFRDPYAQKRALMTNVASKGEISTESALAKIQNQEEESLRLHLRNKEAAEAARVKSSVLSEYIRNRDQSRPVDSAELAAISSLRDEDIESPEKLSTAVERNFAREITNRGLATKPAVREAFNTENPELADGVAKASEDFISRRLIAERHMERMKVQAEAQSWAGWGADIAKQLIPGYTWYKKHDLATQSVLSDILTGDNMIAQIQYLYSLPPEQFDKTLGEVLDRLGRDNTPLAAEFAKGVVQYSSMDRGLDNAFDILEVAGVADIGKDIGKMAIKGFTKKTILKNAVKDVAEAAGNPKSTAADIVAATGDIDSAAVLNAAKAVQLRAKGLTKAEEVAEFADIVAPSIARPSAPFAGPSRLAAGQAVEVAERLATSGENVMNALTKRFGVLRLDAETEALRSAIDKALTDMADIHKFDVNNAVLDYRWVPNTDDVIGRSNSVVIELGTQNKSNFDSVLQADNAAKQIYNLVDGDYNIVQKGGGFHIEVRRDLTETADSVRDALVTVANSNPEGLVNLMLGPIRSAEGLLSKTQSQNRKVALGAAETVKRWIEDSFQDLGKYTRDGKNREVLSRLLEQNRKDEKWYNTAQEFEKAFFDTTGRYPTPDDHVAYRQALQISDLDYLVRNSDLYSLKSRQGYMSFEIEAPIMSESAEAATKPFSTFTETNIRTSATKFEGRLVDQLPQKGERHRVLLVSSDGTGKTFDVADYSAVEIKELQKGWADNGYKFIQAYNPLDPALEKFRPSKDNVPVNFIAVRNVKSARLDPVQVPYKPGGHTSYEGGYYVASPSISPILRQGQFAGESYNGEKIVASFRFEKQAKQFMDDLEIARQKLDATDFDQYVQSKFGLSPGEVRAMFDLDKGGVDPKRALYLKNDGQTFKDIRPEEYTNLVDYTESKFNPSAEINLKFISEKSKDVLSFERGSTQNPIWNKTDAQVLDPLLAMRKNLSDVTSSLAYNDYRIRSTEEWIEQYGDLFVANGVSKEALRLAPMHYIHRAESNLKGSTGDAAHIAAAKQSLKAIQHLISVPSEVKQATDFVKSRMLNYMFDKNPKVAEWMDEKLMYTTADPLKFLRSAAFHLKLGLFNPAQLFLQGQAMFNVVALSPKHGAAAVKDFVGMRALMVNDQPQHLAHWGKKYSNGKDFVEMYTAGRESGWFSTGGNLSVNQALAEPTIGSGGLGKALDFSAVFFKEGELVNRMVSWSTAWREFKAANPGKAITDIEIRSILQRADDLTINMTRASNANIQNGFGSIPTQFWSYQWRLAESMWTSLLGKGALSRGEASRLLAMNGALYGIPVGVMGPMTAIWPWQESIEKYAQENGIDLDANLITKTLSRGLFEITSEVVDGRQYALAERFGPGGLPTLKQLIDGDKPANLATGIELFLGVSGATALSAVNNAAPLWGYIGNVFRGPDTQKPFAVEDVLDALKTITTVNNATKAYLLAQYSTYYTRTGVPIKNSESVNIMDVMAQTLGVQPREMAKFYARKDVIKDQRAASQELTKALEAEFSRAFRATAQGDTQSAENHFNRARVLMEGLGRLSVSDRNQLFVNTLRKFKDEDMNELNRIFMMKAPNAEIQKGRIDMIERERLSNGR